MTQPLDRLEWFPSSRLANAVEPGYDHSSTGSVVVIHTENKRGETQKNGHTVWPETGSDGQGITLVSKVWPPVGSLSYCSWPQEYDKTPFRCADLPDRMQAGAGGTVTQQSDASKSSRRFFKNQVTFSIALS